LRDGFSDIDHFGVRLRQSEDLAIDQPIINDDICVSQCLSACLRQQSRVAGTRANEPHRAWG
jgi:hypothetical protein